MEESAEEAGERSESELEDEDLSNSEAGLGDLTLTGLEVAEPSSLHWCDPVCLHSDPGSCCLAKSPVLGGRLLQ